MKKTILTALLMTTTLGIFAQSGVIKELSGTVELKNAGAADYVPAKAGDTVAQSTVIFTGIKSMALIEVGSAVIFVRPMTRLTLTEISAFQEEEILNVNLQAGRVRVDVNPPAGIKTSMNVMSTVATASVRGTSFYFDTRNLYVDHGTVLFKGNKGYTVQVSDGSVSGVAAGNGKASEPVVVTTSPSASVPQILAAGPDAGLEPPALVGKEPSSAAGNTGGAGTIIPSVPAPPPDTSTPDNSTPSSPDPDPGGGGIGIIYPK